MNSVPFRSSFEPTFSPWRFAYVVASRASCAPERLMNRPRVTSVGVTTPMAGLAGSTPAIV